MSDEAQKPETAPVPADPATGAARLGDAPKATGEAVPHEAPSGEAAHTNTAPGAATPPPAPGKKRLALLLSVLALAIFAGSWFILQSKEPAIAPQSPAAQLQRDDAAEQAKAQAALEAAKAGKTPALEPRLFLNSAMRYPSLGDEEWDVRFVLEMDKKKCADYAGSWEQCKQVWQSFTVQPEALQTAPSLPGTWKVNKDNSEYVLSARFSLPLNAIPDTDKVPSLRILLPALGKNVEVNNTTLSVALPKWDVSPSLSALFIDPENPRRLLTQASISSTLPLDRKSLESRLRFTLQGKNGTQNTQGTLGTPEGTWANDTTYTVILPIEKLPAEPASLVLSLDKGVSRAHAAQSTKIDFQTASSIPGRDTFIAINDISFATRVDDNGMEDSLVLVAFTAPVASETVAKTAKAKLLPLYRTAEDEKNKTPFDWSTLQEIPAAVLEKAPEVPLKPEPLSGTYSSQIAFRYKAPEGRYVYITGKGPESNTGYAMKGNWKGVLEVPAMERELRFMQEGNILNLNGARKLAIVSRGMDSIEWQAWRMRPEFLNLLVNGSYSLGERSYSAVEFNEFSDSLEGSIALPQSNDIAPQYSALDLGPWLEKGARGIFSITMRGKANGQTQETVERFVLLTDLGLVVKKDDKNNRSVFVSSLAKGTPIAGAKVRVIARNGVVLVSSTTDASGKAELPDVSGFYNERSAVAIEVRNAEDMTYLSLNESKSAIPVRGDRSASHITASGLNIFVFSERGIYRPGETLHFGLIAKDADWNPEAAAAMRLGVRLKDPLEKVVAEKTVPLSPQGMGEVALPTREENPTGRYYLEVLLGDRLVGSTNVQLEEFQPDRLKVTSRLLSAAPGAAGITKGWLLPQDLHAEVKVENLYGTPAQESTVQASYSAKIASTGFIQYQDYVFSSPANKDASSTMEDVLGEQVTDETGSVRFNLPLGDLENATYAVQFEAEAFEAGGGRSVVSHARAIVSPYTQFIGWRSNARLNFLAKDAPATVDFIALGHLGNPVEAEPMTLTIRSVEYTNVLVRQDSGAYRYEQQRHTEVVEKRPLPIGKEGVSLSLPTQKPGDFELSLEDTEGVVRSGLSFTVAGGANRWQGLKRDATLRIRLDKENYNAGEEIQVFLSAPYAGAGLITLESNRVLAHSWFKAETTDSVQRITVPENFEGRGFLLVHMLRDMNAKEIHMAPASHAIAPFYANMARRDMGLALTTPEKVIPGENLPIGVSAAKPGKAFVFAVDEGILQLTNYKTPSPLTFFLKEKIHAVQGNENWAWLMPEFGLVQRESAFGGDVEAASAKRLNPFRRKAEASVVFWSGLMDVGPEPTTLHWPVPAYFNGRLRVMAVAAGPESVGEYATKTLVRAPVIITPNLPVAVAPGDSFDVTVALANNLEGEAISAPVTLNVALDEGLTFATKPETTIEVPKGGEGRVTFRLTATDRLGESTVRFAASIGEGQTAVTVKRPISLSVRPAVPRMTAFAAGRMKKNEQVIPVARELFPQFARVEASLSGLPLPLVDGLSRYLMEFPHGCTEQILSTAFPYALLRGNAELMPVPKGKTAAEAQLQARAAVERGIQTLQFRQVKPGRFALWPQQGYTYSFLTVYSLDFLLTAREAGFVVPEDLLANSLQETRTLLYNKPQTMNQARLFAYAAWVYTRAGKSGLGENLRDISRHIKHLDTAVSGWRKDVTAALLAGTYSMMRQTKEAEALLRDVTIAGADAKKPWNGDGWFMSPLWANGLYMSVLASQFPDRLTTSQGRELLIALVNAVGTNQYTTTGAVQAVAGIKGYATAAIRTKQQEGTPQQIGGKALGITARTSEHTPLPLESTGNLVQRLAADNRAAEFLFTGAEGLFWQLTSDGYDRILPPKGPSKKLDVQVHYLPVKGGTLQEVEQGDEVDVLVVAKTLEGPMDNIAITSLLPGGFEMVISRGGQLVGAGTSGSDQSASDETDGDDAASAANSDDAVAEEEDDEDTGERSSASNGNDSPRAYPSDTLMEDVAALLRESGQSGYSPMALVHVERREDRMVLFTSLDTKEKAFVYRIKAANKGTFSLPATFVEALYDPDARARTEVGTVEVR